MASGKDIFFLMIICIISGISHAHVPVRYWDWAEPDASMTVVSSMEIAINRQNSQQRLTALRTVLAERGVDAYIVPTADAHNSQYIAASDARRTWLSGLSGSSGTAVVTSSAALVWTDGRYWTQFEMEVNTQHWTLMRDGIDVSIQSWLLSNLNSTSVVGIDPTTYTRNAWTPLQNNLASAGIVLQAVTENLVDIARATIGDPAPPRPNNPLLPLTINYTGRPAYQKIADLLTQINQRGASALVLTALDDIAYTLNLRGTDIPYNPVFFSYLVIRAGVPAPDNVILFWGSGALAADVMDHLNLSENVQLVPRPYAEITDYLSSLTSDLPQGSTIWLSQDGSHAIHLAAESNNVTTLSTLSPVALMKCVKNEVELEGFRSAHVKDGTAVVRFLRWVHEQVANDVTVTEMDVSNKLLQLRGEESDFMGPSFSTIAGTGANGAVIHYSPSDENPAVIQPDDMLLVDSGGQYRDGTTDITRTRHMSESPTDEQRVAFTRVMKGQIALATAVFPRGLKGDRLETLARKSLWDVGLNYAHGTGHGVGHYLNVHEGPSGILTSALANDPGIEPAMIFSNEPGFYEVGQYGIRHEDLVEVIELNKDSDHILASGLVGDFDGVGALGFHTISLAPHQTSSLDISLLTDFEIKYLNDYHARVQAIIGPRLLMNDLVEDYEWLLKECAPIQRSSAVLLKITPLLLIVTVIKSFL